MFEITGHCLKVPQLLWYFALFGGIALAVVSAGLLLFGIFKKKGKGHILSWLAIGLIAFSIFALAFHGVIAGSEMFGG